MAVEETPFPTAWLPSEAYDPSGDFTKITRTNRDTGEKITHDYLTVQQRLCWFTIDQRTLIAAKKSVCTYSVKSEIIELDRSQGFAHFMTTIRDVLGNEVTAFGSCSRASFLDYIEKAETKSIGRALGKLGYNTASAQEFSEEGTPVDAPEPERRPASAGTPRAQSDRANGQRRQNNAPTTTADTIALQMWKDIKAEGNALGIPSGWLNGYIKSNHRPLAVTLTTLQDTEPAVLLCLQAYHAIPLPIIQDYMSHAAGRVLSWQDMKTALADEPQRGAMLDWFSGKTKVAHYTAAQPAPSATR